MSWFPWRFGGNGYIEFPAPSSGGPSFGSSGKIYTEFEWDQVTKDTVAVLLKSKDASNPFPYIWTNTGTGQLTFVLANSTDSVWVNTSNNLKVGNNSLEISWNETNVRIVLNGILTTAAHSVIGEQSSGYTLMIGSQDNSYYRALVGKINTLKAWSNPNASLNSTPDILQLGPQSGSNVFNLANPSVMGTAYGNCSCLIKPARKGFRPLTSSGYCTVAHHSDFEIVDEAGAGAIFSDTILNAYNTKELLLKSGSLGLRKYTTSFYSYWWPFASLGIPFGGIKTIPNYVSVVYSAQNLLQRGWVNGKLVISTSSSISFDSSTDPIIIGKDVLSNQQREFALALAYILNKNITGYEPTDADISKWELYLAMGDYSGFVNEVKDKVVGLWLLIPDTLEGSPGNYYFPDLSTQGSSHPAMVVGTKDVDWELIG